MSRLRTTLPVACDALTGVNAPSEPVCPDRDADLVAELLRGAPGAVESLVARYGDLLYRLAVGITGNNWDAEEAVQDALCAAVYRIESFRHESAFRSWLYRIGANAAYGARRRRRHARQELSWDEVRPGITESGKPLGPLTDGSADAEQPVVQGELRLPWRPPSMISRPTIVWRSGCTPSRGCRMPRWPRRSASVCRR